MSTDQYTLTDPTKLYADIDTRRQTQPGPGLDAKLRDEADLGESTYRGSGRLEGRKALITGGDSGIGAATAIAFAREGADVAISYLEEEETDAHRIIELINDAGRKGLPLPGDLTDPTYCRNLVAQAVEGLGGLDILVNNGAEQTHVEDLADLTDELFDQTLKTNVYAMFWVTKAALPHLQARRDDHQHILDPGLQPLARPGGLRDHQGRDQQLLQGAGPAAGPARHPGQRRSRPGRCGPRCRPRAASRRRSCPSSARTPRWAGPPSPPSSPRRTSSWPRPSPATWRARP